MGEVYGQALYYDKHGHFPDDQPAVTLAYARTLEMALGVGGIIGSQNPKGWDVV
jgi:hypothetical protein